MQQLQARSQRHLDHRRPALVDQAVFSVDRAHQWIEYAQADPLSAVGQEGVQRAVAAIRDRQLLDNRAQPRLFKPARNRGAGFRGGQALLEGASGNQDLYALSFAH